MKKALVIMLAMAFAAPLYADITFSSTTASQLDWVSDTPIVAMGLDVDADGTVDAVAVDSFFDIYMDAAHDMEETTPGSYTYGAGIATAEQDVVGALALPATSFAISMGGLGGTVAPLDTAPTSGSITMTASSGGTATICANSLRGSVVDNTGAAVTIAGDCATLVLPDDGCVIADSDRNAAWVLAGSPDCWCEERQCKGDADNFFEGTSKTGYYAVGAEDLKVLAAGWGILDGSLATVVEPDTGREAGCANFNNNVVGTDGLLGGKEGTSKTGYYQVGSLDLDILAANWGVLDPGVVGDCLPGSIAGTNPGDPAP
jgi:hypothetical protein